MFPAMESRGLTREGGPIGMMLYEHKLARGFVRKMHDALMKKQPQGSVQSSKMVTLGGEFCVS